MSGCKDCINIDEVAASGEVLLWGRRGENARLISQQENMAAVADLMKTSRLWMTERNLVVVTADEIHSPGWGASV